MSGVSSHALPAPLGRAVLRSVRTKAYRGQHQRLPCVSTENLFCHLVSEFPCAIADHDDIIPPPIVHVAPQHSRNN